MVFAILNIVKLNGLLYITYSVNQSAYVPEMDRIDKSVIKFDCEDSYKTINMKLLRAFL